MEDWYKKRSCAFKEAFFCNTTRKNDEDKKLPPKMTIVWVQWKITSSYLTTVNEIAASNNNAMQMSRLSRMMMEKCETSSFHRRQARNACNAAWWREKQANFFVHRILFDFLMRNKETKEENEEKENVLFWCSFSWDFEKVRNSWVWGHSSIVKLRIVHPKRKTLAKRTVSCTKFPF